MPEWWKIFFDADYLWLWGETFTAEQNAQQAGAIWELLRLRPGSRLLDAPCGYGRLSVEFARRGAIVLGVDQSEVLLAEAARNNPCEERLRYLRHDLRQLLPEGGFDAACNVFSSIGYGSEEDDLAIFTALRHSVRPGGLVFVETNHRDATVAFLTRGMKPATRLADGTLIVEEPVFDPVEGRINTCWYWSGPRGSGNKPASLRIYSITELVRLLERAGLGYISAFKGCSPQPFKPEGPDMGGRVGILTRTAV
ncbi:MAG TPA: methyltransferase domain-containing protein [Terriglobales bacterium]|nr:methyltransferase domain-containing protein [Terriglobales bacterium]